jgi:hypothetical protein
MILILLAIVAVIAFGIIAYNLAVLAMPLWVAMAVFQHVHQSAGVVPSLIVAIIAGFASIGVVMMVMGLAKNLVVRLVALAVFVVPAAIAGYALVYGILKDMETGIALHLYCAAGSVFIAICAMRKLIEIAEAARDD